MARGEAGGGWAGPSKDGLSGELGMKRVSQGGRLLRKILDRDRWGFLWSGGGNKLGVF